MQGKLGRRVPIYAREGRLSRSCRRLPRHRRGDGPRDPRCRSGRGHPLESPRIGKARLPSGDGRGKSPEERAEIVRDLLNRPQDPLESDRAPTPQPRVLHDYWSLPSACAVLWTHPLRWIGGVTASATRRLRHAAQDWQRADRGARPKRARRASDACATEAGLATPRSGPSPPPRQTRASPRRRSVDRPDRRPRRPAFRQRRVRPVACGAMDPRPRFRAPRRLSTRTGPALLASSEAAPGVAGRLQLSANTVMDHLRSRSPVGGPAARRAPGEWSHGTTHRLLTRAAEAAVMRGDGRVLRTSGDEARDHRGCVCAWPA
jgi:hypothetical protein